MLLAELFGTLFTYFFNSGASLIISNLREIDNPPGGLSFTWDPLFIADCPSLHYMIKATEGCGSCPMSVSDNTATCSNVRRGKMCTLSVFVNLCSDQIRSDVNTVSTGRRVHVHGYLTCT